MVLFRFDYLARYAYAGQISEKCEVGAMSS